MSGGKNFSQRWLRFNPSGWYSRSIFRKTYENLEGFSRTWRFCNLELETSSNVKKYMNGIERDMTDLNLFRHSDMILRSSCSLKVEKCNSCEAFDIYNSGLLAAALAALLLELWLGLRHLLLLLLLPLPPSHCHLEGTLQLCLGVIGRFDVEIALHTNNVALSMPLLRSLLPFHPTIRHLWLEHRQRRQGAHSLHLALQAVQLLEPQGLCLGRRLLGETAALNLFLWLLWSAFLQRNLHSPLLLLLAPRYSRHIAGEVGIPLLRLLEDALVHQLGMEGLGGLQGGRVSLSLRAAIDHELFDCKFATRLAFSLTFGIVLRDLDLPSKAGAIPQHSWHTTLFHQVVPLEQVRLRSFGRGYRKLPMRGCTRSFSDDRIFGFQLLGSCTNRFKDFHSLHGTTASCGCQSSKTILIEGPTTTGPDRGGQVPHPRPHLHAVHATDLVVLDCFPQHLAILHMTNCGKTAHCCTQWHQILQSKHNHRNMCSADEYRKI